MKVSQHLYHIVSSVIIIGIAVYTCAPGTASGAAERVIGGCGCQRINPDAHCGTSAECQKQVRIQCSDGMGGSRFYSCKNVDANHDTCASNNCTGTPQSCQLDL